MGNQITAGNAKAIAFHVRQGEPFGALTPEALANWLDSVALQFEPNKEPVLPTIHLNGTSPQMLLDGYQVALDAVQTAREALAAVEFNARDYYPQAPEAWTKANESRRIMHQQLQSIYESLMAHCVHCANAICERETRKAKAVFSNCNVCGRELIRTDELELGVCAVCSNEQIS